MPANPFDSLGPIDWAAHPALADDAALDAFLAATFADAQRLIDSIPAPAPPTATTTTTTTKLTGRPRAQTDGAVSYSRGGGAAAGLDAGDAGLAPLRGAWKEVRVGGGNNPRHVAVFKHSAGRDGYGGSSWFARRSVHGRETRGGPAGEEVVLSFDVFRRGLQQEFGIVAGSEGDEAEGEDANDKREEAACKIRTMEVARHLEDRRFGPQRSRALHVFQLQAQFPRPTQARDFVTMLLTEHATLPAAPTAPHPPRQFMVVSKPCAHPAAPPRSGFVRAEYESVEVVREVPVPVPSSSGGTRKTRSSMDLGGEEAPPSHEMAVEWLMITRNNPGGNVPRFLVDRNTPSSIVSDANRFLDWLVEQA